MKIKNILSILILSLLLTGCACEHEWSEADCLNAQICLKCQETGADALGHDWVPANCTSPETCSRCGETNGAPAEHRFGEWTVENERMTHSCEECGLEENEELTQEMRLEMLLRGYWEITALVKTQEQEFYSVNVFDSIVGEYLHFEEGQRLSGLINQGKFTGTWEFYQYEKTDDNEIYVFQAIEEDGRDLEMHLTRTKQNDILSVFFGNGVRVLLECHDNVTSEMTGTWASDSAKSPVYTLQFRADHTVSCSLDENFEGRWHLTPMQEAGSLGYHTIYIISDDGTILDGAVIFGSPNAQSPYCISLNWNAENIPNIATNFMTHTKE